MARPTKQDWRPAFLAELATRGHVVAACKKAKVARIAAYEARDKDPEFAAAWALAIDEAVEWMEAEARRRAVEGTLRPIYQGGKKVGAVREYSDALLMFLLGAHKPERYRDNRIVVAGDADAPVKHEHSGSVVARIDELTVAFAAVADREETVGDGAAG